jgi:hypothetical protein
VLDDSRRLAAMAKFSDQLKADFLKQYQFQIANS